ncbi:MAG: sulfotransferase-like domain-containing protein, partial [Acidimicrobiales bacterium]
HMTHHLLPEVERSSLAGIRHAYLIRDPRALVPSYARVRAEPTLADLGLPQQVELFETFGGPVVDADDLRRSPAGTLSQLCGALGVPWDPAMLSWRPGPRPTDGVWARHWYSSVYASTGFEPPDAAGTPPATPLPGALQRLVDDCAPLYDRLRRHRLAAA